MSIFLAAVVFVASLFVLVMLAIMFRIVVPTNMVHIVQRRNSTTSYGTAAGSGNVYYRWPTWVPRFGVTTIELPVSNFLIPLPAYEAYDKERVPFVVDVVAFFRISDPNRAAERVSHFNQLSDQLMKIVQGAVRNVLASADIHSIMLKRPEFGRAFTEAVKDQLKEWGVESVKIMELMDVRDATGAKEGPIHNIMAMQQSHIEQESRSKVAENMRLAMTAEIDADRAVKVRAQEAEQAVGERTALKEQAVGVANQVANQEILSAERETKERAMAVTRVEQVRQAEITKDQQIVAAEEDKQTRVIKADGEAQAIIRKADGDRQAEQLRAQGIEAVGKAEGSAETARLRAPVVTQIELAKEIGANDGYQTYLVRLKAVEIYGAVGAKYAEALQQADVKVIANTGRASDGIEGIGELVSPSGGLKIGAMAEALANTPVGAEILKAVGVGEAKPKPRRNNGLRKEAAE